MHHLLRFASCLLLAALAAPATINHANDNTGARPSQADKPDTPGVRQFSDAELSAARETLAALTPEQRVLLNHLRYLMRPQYEEELMVGRAFSPCPLPPFEQPGTPLETADLLRLWAVLASGMPATDSTGMWLRQFVEAPLPAGGDSLGELGLQMALCAQGARRPEFELNDMLLKRARQLLDAADKSRRATADNSPLIIGKQIEPQWYANQLWRALINSFGLELELNIHERAWGSAVGSLLSAADKAGGWSSKPAGGSDTATLDSNLLAIAAISLAAAAPEGTLGKGQLRSIDQSLRDIPGLLKRLDTDHAGVAQIGSRLAVILSFTPELAPENTEPDAWRKSLLERAMEAHEPSGMVQDGLGRVLGLATGRGAVRVCETSLECVALSGGLMGAKAPLAGLSIAEIGRAMHACSVIHAAGLPEGVRRTFSGNGHELPEPGAIEKFMLKGLDFLADAQHESGGWGASWGARSGGAGAAGTVAAPDPGTTAFVALALLRAGHTPFRGDYKNEVLKATRYVVDAVEKAKEDGPRITEASGTQLQGKLGQIVDTAVVTQFLARVLHLVESDSKLQGRVEDALDKCVCKIEESQGEDGGWITQGWAPVLQSAMFNQALELAELAGRDVDRNALERSRAYLAHDVEIETEKTTSKPEKAPRRSVSAGVAFYAGSSAMRATAGYTAEVMIAMQRAIKDKVLPANTKVSEASLRKIGYGEAEAAAKARAYLQHETLLKKLEDEKYLKGFGNNGGEEFISYMMSSESIVITGGESWSNWNKKMHTTFEKIQNADGSWSGHHCISSPVLCTAAVLLCLTADREVHVMVETGPSATAGKPGKKKEPKPSKKPESPVTGK